MNLQLAFVLLHIFVTIALTACGGANEEVYNDRKIYVYTDEPPAAGKGQADANPRTGNGSGGGNAGTGPGGETGEEEPAEKGEVVASGSLAGALNAVSTSGKVTGWATWDQDSAVMVQVKIAIDGVEAASLTANVDAFDDDTPGAHGFSFDLPASFKDGKDHSLEATASHAGEALAFAKQTFKISPPAQAGRDFFAANLQATLQNRCGGCHPVNYDQQYASLSTPLPSAGGTVTNNELINMASGRNGNVNHPGGNVCGGKNAGVCVQIQQWWNVEFGAN